MKTKIFILICADIFLISQSQAFFNDLSAQSSGPDTLNKSFRLFEDENLIEVSLRFDLSIYFRAKPQKEYLKAYLTFNLSKKDSISREIRLRTRGIFRNSYCMFAPIELNLKKANFGYSDLNGISKLKLVPQCGAGKDKEDYVLREFLAYKLFNVLTDTSFRVRLLIINYIDSQKDKKPVKQYGFFLEPAEMLASRTNCFQVKTSALKQNNIIPGIMDRLAIFNYMIGNYDWSVPGQHNVFVMKSKNYDPNGLGISIPYDFDWSGLVNPVYAIPKDDLGIEDVRERIFLGVCRSKDLYDKELTVFLEKKQEFYKVINDFQYIDKRVKKDLTQYLDGFFDMLVGKRDRILGNMESTCKKI